MGDFFVPGPGPIAPAPEVDTPPPDFRTIGAEQGQGQYQAWVASGWLKDLLNTLVRWVSAVLGGLINAVWFWITWIMQVFNRIDEKTDANYAQAVAATVGHLFDTEVNPSSVAGRGQGDQRKQLQYAIGKSIVDAMFAGAPTQGTGGLEPSDTGALSWTAKVMHLGFEGWMESWLADALSYHVLEKFGDLKDITQHMLGLGRLSHQALRPPMKILVHDPYLALLNERYRPEHLPHTTAIRQFARGKLSRSDLSTILGRQGWREAYIDFLINENTKFLSEAELEYAMTRGIWTEDQATKYLQDQGYDLPTAQTKVAALIDRRIDRYRQELVKIYVDAYIRGDIDAETRDAAIKQSGLSDEEQQWIIRIAGSRRETEVKHLPLGLVEQMIRKGILNVDDLRTWMQRENYPLQEEQFLELLLLEEISEASAGAKAKAAKAQAAATRQQQANQARQAKAAAIAEKALNQGVSMANAERLVLDGQWTFAQYTTFLQRAGVGAEAIPELVQLLHEKADAAAAKGQRATTVRGSAAQRGLNLAQTETAYKEGVITETDLRSSLAGLNYDESDVNVLVEVLNDEIAAAKAKASTKATSSKKASAAGISLVDIERAVKLGVTPIDTYRAALVSAGDSQETVDFLVSILAAEAAATRAAAAKRAVASQGVGQGVLKLGQVEAEVVAGIKPMSAYGDALRTLGYTDAEISDLEALLQLKTDHAAAVQAKRKMAEARAGATGLSLAEINTATKLGVLSIDAYTALLSKIGFQGSDLDTLRLSMLAAIAKTRKAATTATQVSAAVKAKGLSRAEAEAAYVAGLQSLDWYTGQLLAAGVSASDVDTLVGLAQLKHDNAVTAGQKRADAEARAADRDLPLSRYEAAVVGGQLTMDDYRSILADLGYQEPEVSILVGLLTDKVATANAKAAKAAAKSGAASSPPQPGP